MRKSALDALASHPAFLAPATHTQGVCCSRVRASACTSVCVRACACMCVRDSFVLCLLERSGPHCLSRGLSSELRPFSETHPLYWHWRSPTHVRYYAASGSWPDLTSSEDQAKVGASVFAFVNVARFAVPLRVGLALSTTPWIAAVSICRDE